MKLLRGLEEYPIIHRGSTKNKRVCKDGTLLFEVTDAYSVFDVGVAPDLIPGKGAALTKCYLKSVSIAEALGVRTHFIEQVADNVVRVKEAQVITDRHPTPEDRNFLVNLELIFRIVVAGSKLRAFQDGSENPADYGFPAGYMPTQFDYFPWPVRHHTTKFEPVDRTLKDLQEICRIGGITLAELEHIWDVIWRLSGGISSAMRNAGYISLDGKFEVVLGPDREVVIADFFGTPDEDRPVLADEFVRETEIIHYSKEYIREIHIASGYHQALKSARKEGRADPPIPRLTEDQIAEVAFRYERFATDYAAA